ncbi:unnamed protein product [Amoebophrya sp. A25]|nr:unnamed protein product [Amoebophrya sp. A25]|eukprot:GSA25T00005003001.1
MLTTTSPVVLRRRVCGHLFVFLWLTTGLTSLGAVGVVEYVGASSATSYEEVEHDVDVGDPRSSSTAAFTSPRGAGNTEDFPAAVYSIDEVMKNFYASAHLHDHRDDVDTTATAAVDEVPRSYPRATPSTTTNRFPFLQDIATLDFHLHQQQHEKGAPGAFHESCKLNSHDQQQQQQVLQQEQHDKNHFVWELVEMDEDEALEMRDDETTQGDDETSLVLDESYFHTTLKELKLELPRTSAQPQPDEGQQERQQDGEELLTATSLLKQWLDHVEDDANAKTAHHDDEDPNKNGLRQIEDRWVKYLSWLVVSTCPEKSCNITEQEVVDQEDHGERSGGAKVRPEAIVTLREKGTGHMLVLLPSNHGAFSGSVEDWKGLLQNCSQDLPKNHILRRVFLEKSAPGPDAWVLEMTALRYAELYAYSSRGGTSKIKRQHNYFDITFPVALASSPCRITFADLVLSGLDGTPGRNKMDELFDCRNRALAHGVNLSLRSLLLGDAQEVQQESSSAGQQEYPSVATPEEHNEVGNIKTEDISYSTAESEDELPPHTSTCITKVEDIDVMKEPKTETRRRTISMARSSSTATSSLTSSKREKKVIFLSLGAYHLFDVVKYLTQREAFRAPFSLLNSTSSRGGQGKKEKDDKENPPRLVRLHPDVAHSKWRCQALARFLAERHKFFDEQKSAPRSCGLPSSLDEPRPNEQEQKEKRSFLK